MNSFVFAINAVMPIVLLVALGYYAKNIKLMNEQFCAVGNRFCFRVLLPILLFMNIYKTNGIEDIQWDLAVYACIIIFWFYNKCWGVEVITTSLLQHFFANKESMELKSQVKWSYTHPILKGD